MAASLRSVPLTYIRTTGLPQAQKSHPYRNRPSGSERKRWSDGSRRQFQGFCDMQKIFYRVDPPEQTPFCFFY